MLKRIKRLLSHPLTRSSFSTTIWSGAGKSVGFLIPFFIAAWFGVSGDTDVFFFVYGVIILFTSIFANAIESVIVPFISGLMSKEKSEIDLFLGNILFLAVVVLSVLAVAVIVIAKPLFGIITRFSPSQLNLLVMLLAEIAPLIVLISITSILSGALNAFKIFWLPAFSPALRAIVTLSAIFFLKSSIGIHAVAVGYVLGEISRFAVLAFFIKIKRLFKISLVAGYRPEDRHFIKTASFYSLAAAIIGLNPMIDKTIASWVGEGAVSILEYGYRVYLIPLLFLTGGFVNPVLSHWSMDYTRSGMDNKIILRKILSAAKVLIPIFLVVTLLVELFSGQIIKIIYAYGKFPENDMSRVLTIFRCYALAFCPHVLNHIIPLGFIILKRTSAFVIIALAYNLLNIISDIVLVRFLGLMGIPLSLTLVQLFAVFISLWYLRKNTYGKEENTRRAKGDIP